MPDRVNLLYSDMTCSIETDFAKISDYADAIRRAALRALGEQAVLVVVYPVHHSQ